MQERWKDRGSTDRQVRLDQFYGPLIPEKDGIVLVELKKNMMEIKPPLEI